MSEEIEKNSKEVCICKTQFFRKFLANTLGTFFGVYFALCLFCLLHRPPMFPQMMMQPQMPLPPIVIQQDGGCKCHKMMDKMMKNDVSFKKAFEKMQKETED